MSDSQETRDPSSQLEELANFRKQAADLIGELRDFRSRAEEHVIAAETFRKKADSEGLFAFNAKNTVEKHATAVSQTKGQVETDVSVIQNAKNRCEEIAQALSTIRVKSDEAILAVEQNRTKIDEIYRLIEDRKQKVQTDAEAVSAFRTTADQFFKQLQDLVVSAKTDKETAESHKTSTELQLVSIKTNSSAIEEYLNKSTQCSAKTAELMEQSDSRAKALYELVGRLERTHDQYSKAQNLLAELNKKYQTLSEKVEALLPGATSASLASAFSAQKQRFKKPKLGWIAAFMICIAILVVISWPGLIETSGSDTGSWDSIIRHLIQRLPLVIPLVWLAIYAGRNYMLASRIEEDYAYKEAISTAFEGYKREMSSIEVHVAEGMRPLHVLCTNVLTAMADPPGRVYESRMQDITPITPLSNALADNRRLAATKIAD